MIVINKFQDSNRHCVGFSIIGLFLLFIATVLPACGSNPPSITAVKGRSLEIHVRQPLLIQKLGYTEGSEHRIIQAKASNRQLAAVQVTVVNRTSTVIPLNIDIDVVKIGDRRGQKLRSIDPFKEFTKVDVEDPSAADGFLPFLWGHVELARFTEATGWMIFEVPIGLRLGSLWWEEVDYIILDFPSEDG